MPEDHTLPLRELTIIYLTVAYETDHRLTESEIDGITEKTGKWVPGAEKPELHRIVREVMATYVQEPNRDLFAEAADVVGRDLSDDQHEALLTDLSHVAAADHNVSDGEWRMIRSLARAWDVDAKGLEIEALRSAGSPLLEQ